MKRSNRKCKLTKCKPVDSSTKFLFNLISFAIHCSLIWLICRMAQCPVVARQRRSMLTRSIHSDFRFVIGIWIMNYAKRGMNLPDSQWCFKMLGRFFVRRVDLPASHFRFKSFFWLSKEGNIKTKKDDGTGRWKQRVFPTSSTPHPIRRIPWRIPQESSPASPPHTK